MPNGRPMTEILVCYPAQDCVLVAYIQIYINISNSYDWVRGRCLVSFPILGTRLGDVSDVMMAKVRHNMNSRHSASHAS